jgi:thiol-disulfide isomerase/thioredoxin
MDPARPSEGLRVGEFSTGAIDGRTITDRDVAEGSVLVGFFADGCPNCARLVADLGIAQPHERMVAFVAGQRGDELTDRLTADLSGWCDAVAVVGVGDQVSQAFNLQAFPTLIRLVDGAVKKAGFTLEDMGLGARVRIMPAS